MHSFFVSEENEHFEDNEAREKILPKNLPTDPIEGMYAVLIIYFF